MNSVSEAVVYETAGARVELSSGAVTRRILDNVELRVREREIAGIVGRSGTGKTTLLRVLGGLLPPSEGMVTLDGRAFSAPPQGVVTVFQDYGNALLPWRSVRRNVALPLEGRFKREEIGSRVREALAAVGLAGRDADRIGALSGGMQQRVQIARALALRPRVLLMDEPFGALDAMTKATLQDVLLRLHEHTGVTIVFITHDLDEAIYLSDTVHVIDGQPGTLTERLDVALPRPRHQVETREDPEYIKLRHRLADIIDLTHSC
jgi:NitT/TauT family transport system ATP-binding protein